MAENERNKRIYLGARYSTGCSQNDWARLFNLQPVPIAKHRQKGQPNVAAKENGNKGVSLSECLASELLRYFHEQGFDVRNTQFDENGHITFIPINKPHPKCEG